MKIANIITISKHIPSRNAYEESQIWLIRPYKLTYLGAQRIIRKGGNGGFVTRIETAIYA
jgi:hypothetical protein